MINSIQINISLFPFYKCALTILDGEMDRCMMDGQINGWWLNVMLQTFWLYFKSSSHILAILPSYSSKDTQQGSLTSDQKWKSCLRRILLPSVFLLSFFAKLACLTTQHIQTSSRLLHLHAHLMSQFFHHIGGFR